MYNKKMTKINKDKIDSLRLCEANDLLCLLVEKRNRIESKINWELQSQLEEVCDLIERTQNRVIRIKTTRGGDS